MNSAFRLTRSAIAVLLLLPAMQPWAAESTTDAVAADAAAQMHEHLQSIERDLRLRLLKIADRETRGSASAQPEEIQRLRRHLRSLEERIQVWRDVDSEAERDRWVKKVRTLSPLIDNLERASEHPESVAGLAVRREALTIDWPVGEVRAEPPGFFKGSGNDDCADATPIGNGTFFGDLTEATPDGEGCVNSSPDVWFAYSSPVTVDVVADTFGSSLDTVLAVHTGCPGTFDNEIACNDDFFGRQSAVAFRALAGETYLIRVANSYGNETGPFTLNVGPAGGFSGTVNDEMTGQGVSGVELYAHTADGFFVGEAVTDADGSYMVPGLPTGDYVIYTSNPQGYLPEVYDDVRCDTGYCEPTDGTSIPVIAGAITSGIDLALNRGGQISGTVTEAATGAPIANVSLRLWDRDGQSLPVFARTNQNGQFLITGLWADSYFVTADSQLYRDELYDNIDCQGGCDPRTGTAIEVSFDATTEGVDFALDRLGAISGSVLDAVTGLPITTADIEVYNDSGLLAGFAFVDETGAYEVGGLAAGNYFVATFSFDYRDEVFDDQPCGRFCDPSIGTPIPVTLGSTTPNIDFALDRLGMITGTVTHAVTGAPLAYVDITIFDDNGSSIEFGFTGVAGDYLVDRLFPGTYTARASSFEYVSELYDEIPCSANCDPTTGTPIPVSLNTVAEGVDFTLDERGAIAGRVTHAVTGQPLESIFINVFDANGYPVAVDSTDGAGEYLIRVPDSGNHFAFIRDFEYVGELYNELPCPDGCDPLTGTPIPVSPNAVTGGIDFTLDEKGQISGRITHAITGQPLTDASVDIFDANGSSVAGSFVDSAGEYLVRGLEPGTYFAIAAGFEFVEELYQELPCGVGCSATDGTPIAVSLNAVAGGIDFTLDEKGRITGRVLHAGQPVTDALIQIYNDFGQQASEFTDSEGRYVVRVPGGTYYAVAHHYEFDDELYDNLPCEDFCDPLTGTPIPASVNSTTSDIDFDLGYCTPTATSLCLTGDRFRVEAIWENFENEIGPAIAEPLTADAGTFWFFNPGNIELVVKVLDVCIEPHNRFWVFGAGLTDVGVQLRVIDERTGEFVTYENPLGTPYVPVLDTQAFATCDAGFRRGQSASVASEPAVAEPLTLLAKGGCQPGATSLCLNGGRFQAEVTWLAPNGDGGPARAVPLTNETGYFYFGSADNVEVVVKVLDACALPSRKFWVFGAGLTNFEVTLTVTDTVSDVVRVYTNDQGNNFEAITDTSAFDTCDDG